MERVRLRVGGAEFDLQKSLLERCPDGYLKALCIRSSSSDSTEEIIVDRPAQSFAAILAYYQTGELHMPSGICPGAFKKELEFWKISPEQISDCCHIKYQMFFEEQDSLEDYRRQMERKNGSLANTSNSNLREKIWEILDYQSSSIIAKLLFYTTTFMVLLTVIAMALETEPSFQRKLTKSELLEYMDHSDDTDDPSNFDAYYDWYAAADADDDDKCACNTTVATMPTDLPTNISNKTKPKQIRNVRIPTDVLTVLDMTTLAFFSIELITRLLCCPSLKIYFRSVVNVIDFLILVAAYVHIIVENVKKEQHYQVNALDLLEFVKMLRVLRLFRIAINITGCKVMIYTAMNNLITLSMLLFYIFIAMCIFSSFLYFTETRDNIPTLFTAWWWAVVTMTTVGYGDYVPKSHIGRFIGSLCAVCGLLLLSSSIPIFVNNYLMFYQYEAAQVKIRKKGKDCITDINTVTRVNSKCDKVDPDIKVCKSDTDYPENIKVIGETPRPAGNQTVGTNVRGRNSAWN